MDKPILTVVGVGPGDEELLTGQADRVMKEAERLYAPASLAIRLKDRYPAVRAAGLTEIQDLLLDSAADATVAVSGDTGFFSLAKSLGEQLGNVYRLALCPGISSLQYLCARCGSSYENTAYLSLHGRPENLARLAGMAAYRSKVFALTGGGEDIRGALELLAQGSPALRVSVGENLSLPGERIRTGSPRQLLAESFGGLAVMLVENPAPADVNRRLRDGDFRRGEVPMSKENIRLLCAARLELLPTDTVWDVGAGTGSVSVELARRVREGMVWAVERDPAALELIRSNREALGAYNITVAEGEAPGVLRGLPAPDALFVGGGGSALKEVLGIALANNPRVRVCVSAIALETLHRAVKTVESMGMGQLEVECIQVSQAKRTGRYHMMIGQNPVYIISARGTV